MNTLLYFNRYYFILELKDEIHFGSVLVFPVEEAVAIGCKSLGYVILGETAHKAVVRLRLDLNVSRPTSPMYILKSDMSTYAASGIKPLLTRLHLEMSPAKESQSSDSPNMVAVPPRCTSLYWNFRFSLASWTGMES